VRLILLIFARVMQSVDDSWNTAVALIINSLHIPTDCRMPSWIARSYSGRAVYYMKYLFQFKALGSLVRIPVTASMDAFFLYLCCPVRTADLRRADPPSEESYRLSVGFNFQNEFVQNLKRPDSVIRQGWRRRNWGIRFLIS
jgi:hypothetical protein